MNTIQPQIPPSIPGSVPNGYQNLSQIAKASGKLLRNWVSQPVGKTAIAQFKLDHPEISIPIIAKRGKGGGTYAHPLLAARFTAWCNPDFVEHVVEQNALLKEKIRTFQVTTPREIDAACKEASNVRSLAMKAKSKREDEILLIAKTHYASGCCAHPKGHTFDLYLPHWLHAQGHRTDLYSKEVIDAMKAKYGKPKRIDGKNLAIGYSYVWES